MLTRPLLYATMSQNNTNTTESFNAVLKQVLDRRRLALATFLEIFFIDKLGDRLSQIHAIGRKNRYKFALEPTAKGNANSKKGTNVWKDVIALGGGTCVYVYICCCCMCMVFHLL